MAAATGIHPSFSSEAMAAGPEGEQGGSPPWAQHAAGSGPAAALCLSLQTSRRGSTPSGVREKPREATHTKKSCRVGAFRISAVEM